MEDTEEKVTVSLDHIGGLVDTYRKIERQIHQLENNRIALRREILGHVGESDIGTVNGKGVVRVVRSVQRRLSTKLVRDKIPATLLEDCYERSEQVRLTLIRDDL